MKTNYKSKHEKACLKRCVLRSALKQLRSFNALIFDGNLFQSLGADAINDLTPKVLLVMVLGGNNCSSDWDRSIIRPNCCLTLIRSVMYWGASPWIALNAKISKFVQVFSRCCKIVIWIPVWKTLTLWGFGKVFFKDSISFNIIRIAGSHVSTRT